MSVRKQYPGIDYTFVSERTGETDTGVLPAAYGLSNEFALWEKNSQREYGGIWASRVFKRKIQKRHRSGENTLLGRMKTLLNSQKQSAKKLKYKSSSITAEQMVAMWIFQGGSCAACGGSVELLKACFDHNHETGEPRGFVHRYCNVAEGCTTQMAEKEFENFVVFIRGIKMKHSSVYDQPTNMANAGTTTPAAKVSGDIKNDALSNPSRFTRNGTTVATPDADSELETLRELQLGSNGYQCAGFDPHLEKDTSPVARRGFGESVANKGLYQGK